MSSARRSILLLGIAILAGCGSPLGLCTREAIEASMPATLTVDGGTAQEIELGGTVTRGNLGEDAFDRIRSFLQDASRPAASATFTLEGFGANPGWLAFTLESPVLNGEVLDVDRTFHGAGWGFDSDVSGIPLQVSLRVGEFRASSGSGTVTILAAAPLALRADMELRDGEGMAYRIRGDVTFEFPFEAVTCD